ncbi:MAG: histidine kinase [Bacteroidetes bacterium]|nr:histidine kinase [Bacteroidota bacterium]
MNAQNLQDLRFQVLDEKDGISSHWVTHMACDSSGYVWIGTRNGLNRYDGHQFKVFLHEEGRPNSLYDNDGQRLYVAPDGTVWVSSHKGAISRYDPACQCFKHVLSGKELISVKSDKTLGVRFAEKDGTIWYSGNGLGLNMYNFHTGRRQHWDLPNITTRLSETDQVENNTVNFIFKENEQLFWLCTQNGLYRFNPLNGEFTYIQYPDKNPLIYKKASFNKMLPDADRGFWISSWEGGLHYYNRHSGEFENYLFETRKFGFYNLIYDMAEKNAEELWLVSGDRGLGVFNRRTHAFQFTNELISGTDGKIDFLSDILLLPGGAILLSDENAVLRYNPFSDLFHFTSLPISQSQHGHLFSIRKIIENKPLGEIYFATDLGNGLNVMNIATGRLQAYSVPVRADRDYKMRVKSMALDQTGLLWVLSRDHIHSYHTATRQFRQVNPVFEQKSQDEDLEYNNLLQSQNGNLWVHTRAGYIYPFIAASSTLKKPLAFLGNDGKTVKTFRYATIDVRGNIWAVGEQGIGFLGHEKSAGVLQAKSEFSRLTIESVKGIAADSKGGAWLAVNEQGLLHVWYGPDHTLQYKWYAKEEGIKDLRLYSIGVDKSDMVWFAWLGGAGRLHPHTGSIQYFNQSVGMERFSISMNFLQYPGQDFFISVLGKYCRLNEAAINTRIPVPEMYIDGLTIPSKRFVAWTPAIPGFVVQPGEEVFSFNFGCFDFTDQSYHNFAYRLEGWDKEWVSAGSRRFAGYTNLPAGDYVFKVRVQNTEGIWSKELAVKVTIQTWFYKKTWFIFLLILLVSGFIFSMYLLRVRRIREESALKADLNRQIAESRMEALRAQMNPHFIFNSLNSINRYIIRNDAATASLYLTRFSKLIRMVLDNSRHRRISVASELEALNLYMDLERFRFDQKFDYTVQVSESVDIHQLEIPPLIIQPFVENAIWHGLMHKEGKGKLSIQLDMEDGLLCIVVEDNGIGRQKAAELAADKNPTRKSHGIRLTHERIGHLHGESVNNHYEITDLYAPDGNPAGTRVLLKIPVQ